MARFIFQLDPVLRHRETMEQQRQRELALVEGELARMDAELRAIDAAAKGVSAEVRESKLTGTLDMAFIAAHRRYVLAMQRKAVALAQRMATQQQLVDSARKALAEAAKQRKILEKLRERQHDRWKAAQQRREMADLDDVSVQLATDAFFSDSIDERQHAEVSA
jgi:flagellar FliJ protein